MAALVTQGVDEITGAKYSQAAVYSLLLKLETYMRREMEAQSESLANFYLKAFNRILETEGLFQLLQGKGYGQGYIEELGIYQALETAQKEVHANVRAVLEVRRHGQRNFVGDISFLDGERLVARCEGFEWVADASLVPSALGRPPILTIMAMSKRVARLVAESLAASDRAH